MPFTAFRTVLQKRERYLNSHQKRFFAYSIAAVSAVFKKLLSFWVLQPLVFV